MFETIGLHIVSLALHF